MTAPFWMEAAQGWLGLHEDSDAAQEIAARWAEARGVAQPDLRYDRYHWCSVFIGACLGAERFDLSGMTGMVKTWLDFKSAETVYSRAKGIGSVHDGRFGDIVIYDRTPNPDLGHGNFLFIQDGKYIQGLGGNQSDAVNVAPFAKSTVAGIMRPVPTDGVVEKPAPGKHDGSDFRAALELIFDHEGGWSNHPEDPGGATNYGITLATFRDWRRMRGQGDATAAQLRSLSKAEAEEIYRTLYWQAARCDSLDSRAMRLMHFDCAVNQGVARAIRFLQMALGNVDVDGQFGPQTAKAEDDANQAELLIEYAARRMNHYGGLGTFSTFGLGWSRRLMRTALPAYASLQAIEGQPLAAEPPRTGEQRTPAAWLDDPAIRKIAAKGTLIMFDRILVPVAKAIFSRALGPIDGWKSVAGIVLGVINFVAMSYGIEAVEPGGTLRDLIEAAASEWFTLGSVGLVSAGLADKARKASR